MGEFRVGMEVEWISSSNGTTKTKRGRVEAVILKGERPTAGQRKEADAYGIGRDHESYLVRVPGKTKSSRGKLYWPRVSALRCVPATAPADSRLG